MYFITTKRMLEVCFSAHPNIQYRTLKPHPTIDKEPKKGASLLIQNLNDFMSLCDAPIFILYTHSNQTY